MHHWQLSLASQKLLGLVGGPPNGQQVDLVQVAATAWTPVLPSFVAPSLLEELMLVIAGMVQ